MNDVAGLSLVLIFFILPILLMAAAMIFWIMMLIDALRRDFPHSNDKTLWIIILIFANWIGALLYYFMVKKAYNNQPQKNKQND